MKKLALTWATLLVIALTALAQNKRTLNHAGRDFWFVQHILPNQLIEGQVFYISGDSDAVVAFELTSTGTSRNYLFQGGTVLTVILDPTQKAALIKAPVDTVHIKTLHISSDEDITVQYAELFDYDDEGTILYPSDNQQYKGVYYLNAPLHRDQTYPFIPQGLNISFPIVARCDSVELEITPTEPTTNQPANIPFTVKLNKGESYIVSGGPSTLDLSGTRVIVKKSTCCNPINIFLDRGLTFIAWPQPIQGSGYPCCPDKLLDQLIPINIWDTVYPVVRFRNNPYSVLKIVSASNNNNVYFDGAQQFTLNQGTGYDTIINDAVVITSDKPVSITQNMLSQAQTFRSIQSPQMPPDSFSDPSALFVLPLKNGVTDAYFRSLETVPNPNPSGNPALYVKYLLNTITLISKKANVPSVLLNSSNIASHFVAFPNDTSYMYAYLLLDTMTYHLQSAEPIIAYYYGTYQRGSAAYSIGDIHPGIHLEDDVDSFRICINDTVMITAPEADSFLWSNGSKEQSINVNQEGVYAVQLLAHPGCVYNKSYYVDTKPYDITYVSDNVYKCPDDTVWLLAQPADLHLWTDDGSNADTRQVTETGRYTVTETHQSICNQTEHEFIVAHFPEDQPISLGNDTILCGGDHITLFAHNINTFWSDGRQGDTLIVTQPGTYWAQLTDTCGRVQADTILIRDSLCMKSFCNLTFPIAFTPNNDGINDVFRSINYGEFLEYNLEIYDRWGLRVFKTHDKDQGWNGTYMDIPSEIGVYFYMCTYKCPLRKNERILVKGDLTLIR